MKISYSHTLSGYFHLPLSYLHTFMSIPTYFPTYLDMFHDFYLASSSHLIDIPKFANPPPPPSDDVTSPPVFRNSWVCEIKASPLWELSDIKRFFRTERNFELSYVSREASWNQEQFWVLLHIGTPRPKISSSLIYRSSLGFRKIPSFALETDLGSVTSQRYDVTRKRDKIRNETERLGKLSIVMSLVQESWARACKFLFQIIRPL